MPETAMCALHATQRATETCTRCGSFMCAECAAPDGLLCPACLTRYAEESKPAAPATDVLGWVLVAVPVAGGLAQMLLPVAWGTPLAFAVVGATAVLAGVDAHRTRQSAASAAALLALIWIVGYPVYLHRRRNFGRPSKLPHGLAAAVLFFGGMFIHPLNAQERVQVQCKPVGQTLQDGYACELHRTSGHRAVEACWDLAVECDASGLTAHPCAVVEAGTTRTVTVPLSSFTLAGVCKAVRKVQVRELTVTIQP